MLDCPADDDEDAKAEMKNLPYRARVGMLLWLARNTRPDIAYQVNALARVAHNPGLPHWHASTHLLKYVSGTRDMGLIYKRSDALAGVPGQIKPVLWSDATWAPDYGDAYDNYRSTSGWMATVGDNVLSWSSHRQSVVAQSSTESEWYAAGDAAKEAAHLRKLLVDLGNKVHGPITLHCDNQSTIKQSVNSVDQHSSRHVGQRYHYLRQQCNSGKLSLSFVPTTEQRADIFTKVLPKAPHKYLRSLLRVQNMHDDIVTAPILVPV